MWLESPRGGRRLTPLEEFSLSTPGFFTFAGSEWQQGAERSGEEEPTRQDGRRGLITTLGGTRRSGDPQEPGIDRRQLLVTQVDQRVRA